MIWRVERAWRRLRRALNRSEWLTRILRLDVDQATGQENGLVMIQIDGLGFDELRKALARNELPFLRRLIEREHYHLHRMYTGVPATTAAVQAELFYGIRQAVTGFSFYDRASGKLATMIDPETARRVEKDLHQRSDAPLLTGGSGYANNYTGGAREPHFCPAARGWGSGLRDASPLAVAALIVTNLFGFLKMLALALVEAVIAIGDLVHGVIGGKSFFKELKFIPTRIAITVLLRELAVIGAKIDIARGLPVVHVNFLGFDEQAHRRGPDSRFAHWTLKGIDRAIKRLWKAAHLSARRNYGLWVYSDHGQEGATPYQVRFERSFGDAVADVFSSFADEEVAYRSSSSWGPQLHRAGNLGTRVVDWILPGENGTAAEDKPPKLSVAALGPMAMIYWDDPLSDEHKARLSKQLVEEANLPAVLFRTESGDVRGQTRNGEIRLPQDGHQVMGTGHPFSKEASEDLARLCAHRNAGEFVVLGRSGDDNTQLTFATENGSHGGAGPFETSAFSLLPRDAPGHFDSDGPARVSDLRQAALLARGRAKRQVARFPLRKRAAPDTLRLLTYNVHSCIGMDGRLSPTRIARVIARCDPDVVCLQELDLHRPRSDGVDQAHRIAEELKMDFHFNPALQIEEERYGDAVMTHLPMNVIRAGGLPHWRDLERTEPRGAIWVEIDLGSTRLQVINTHLGLRGRDRRLQVDALLGPNWLGHPDCRYPRIMCGDLNALPRSYVHGQLGRQMRDAQRSVAGHKPRPTFSGRFPTARIDHIFVDSGLIVEGIDVPGSQLCRVASDHLPLVADLRLDKAATAGLD